MNKFHSRRRLLTCVLFVYLLNGSISLYSQTSLFEKSVSVNYHNATLKEVMNDLTNQTGVRFSYSASKVSEDQRITATLSQVSLNEALGEVFRDLPVKYELIDNYIILKKGSVENRKENETKISNLTFCGYVKDVTNGEFLVGAAVFIKELEAGTRTNNYGYFSLTVPPGKYTVQISYVGYEDVLNKINMLANTKSDFAMNILPQKLEEVTISAVKEEFIFSKIHASQVEVRPIFVEQQPALMGEPDIIKNLEFQPGICFYGDGSSYFHVRGGNYDQNLIILDEAVIFNPSHMLGIFTPIIPDAIKSVDIYKADFPINYGGRLSSVIDIQAKDGNKNNFSASGDLGLYSSRATLEGPLKKDASSFFISFRRSYFDQYLKPLIPNLVNLHFYDFTTKMNIKMGRKDRLFLTLYKGEDKFKMKLQSDDASGLNWGNTSITMRWNHIFGSRFFTNTTIASSKYDYYLHASVKNNEYWLSKISNTTLKYQLNYYINPNITWKSGVSIGSYEFNPGNYYAPVIADNFRVSAVKSTEVVVYGGAEHQLLPWLRFNYGLRLTSWSDKGADSETFIIQYDSTHQAIGSTDYKKNEVYYRNSILQPGLSLSIKTGHLSDLKASYNRTNQNINLISNSISPFNSMEVWIPAGPNINPQYADIVDLGYLKSFGGSGVQLHTDVYYKWMYNQIGYIYHANMLVNPQIEGELRQGKGRSYGFEISLKKDVGKFSGQISYTYSRSFLKINDLNNNKEYPASFDRPHDLNLCLAFNARPRWLITTDFALISGSRITTPTSYYLYKGYQVPVYTSLNNQQLPEYIRLDLSTRIQLNKPGKYFKHSLTLAIYNILGQKNPIFLYFNKTVNEDGKLVVPVDQLNQSAISPSIRYTFIVMPSLSYQFQF